MLLTFVYGHSFADGFYQEVIGKNNSDRNIEQINTGAMRETTFTPLYIQVTRSNKNIIIDKEYIYTTSKINYTPLYLKVLGKDSLAN